MDKQKADQIINQYFKKIYGFAMKKSFSYDEAEELSAQMVSEIYLSLLHAEEIVNMEGYIWRICEHTYAKYVMTEKKKQGLSIQGMEIPYYDEYDLGDAGDELKKLRREIGFLSAVRRKIVYSFYYEGKGIRQIATEQELSEGTVKWHLNKARNDLKEGFSVERKVGSLGLAPMEAVSFSHCGQGGAKGGSEYYLDDKINLNIVYSVYDAPKTKEEIAEELGMTPVYLEDKIDWLAENGFLVETKGKKYTTYVKFTPKKVSLEMGENILKMQLKAARILVEKYVPQVLSVIKDFEQVYIPGGNKELFEAAAIFYGIAEKCNLPFEKDLSRYRIRPLDGGDYFATVNLKPEIVDPDYCFTIKETVKDYTVCGIMERGSCKYPRVHSWSADSRLSSRTGGWQNNWNSDYDAVYEVMNGTISDTKTHAEKYDRLRQRGFITEDGKVNIIVLKCEKKDFFDMLPKPDKDILDEFAKFALEQAMMVMDILYDENHFKPLTEKEKVTTNLLMFSDLLPKDELRVK